MTAADEFLARADRFATTVEAIADWSAPTPCTDWSASDLVAHVVDTERDWLTQRGASFDPRLVGEPPAVWQAHHAELRKVLSDREFAATAFDGYFGPTTVEDMLLLVYGFDLIVHRWDLGWCTGLAVEWSDREMDALDASIATFGDNLYSPGICAPAVDVPADASRQVALLGRLGRRA